MSSTLEASSPLSRRERERRRRRQEILHAAQAVFAEKGYTHATLDEIAQRAEFGKGTLYNYFEGGKEDILFACFDEIYDDLTSVIDTSFDKQNADGRPFRDVLHAFILASFNLFMERQELFMILIKEAHRMIFSDDRSRAMYFQQQRERLVGSLARHLEAAVAAGELKPMPPHALAHLIMGNVSGLQAHLCMDECAQDRTENTCAEEQVRQESMLKTPETAAEFLTTMLLDGLRA